MKVLILGAGIIGLTTARYLVKRSHQVLIVEREPMPGRVSSFMNGGQFSFTYAEPLASPAMPGQLPAMLLGRHQALKIEAAAFPQVLPWGARFLFNCTTKKFLANTQSVLGLAGLSRAEMDQYVSQQNSMFDFRQTGKLHLYQDEGQLQRAAMLTEIKNHYGFRQEIWDSAKCLSAEPALEGYRGTLAGGIFSPLDQSGDTFKLIQVLQDECLESGRCEIRTGVAVTGFKLDQHDVSGVVTSQQELSADAYVLCAGAESPRLVKRLGIQLPIVPVKGYSITVPALPQAPEINLTDVQHKIVFTKLGDRLRVAGLMEFAGQDLAIANDRIAYLSSLAEAVLPHAGDYSKLDAYWAGLRPMTPDGLPIIGPTRLGNLWLNTGHGMLGSTLAFASARLVADQLDGSESPLDDKPFHAARFTRFIS